MQETLPYRHFLGYRKGADGLPEIVEEEADVVRLIYRLFLEGKTPFGIAKFLIDQHFPTPSGKEKWQTSTVQSILTNEKYKGDALLQIFCSILINVLIGRDVENPCETGI